MFRWTLIILGIIVAVVAPSFFFESAIFARAASVAGVCLILWLSEAVPPFVPTLILWTLAPVALGSLDGRYSLASVLSWAADPVLALFLGGFVLGVATERSGLDKRLAQTALGSAGASFDKFLLVVILLTAFLSMWMSNIAAAALMLACLHPIFADLDSGDALRRALLIGVALGADLGGIATPIGTGPNAIAIASIAAAGQQVSFLEWMIFALPLTIGMLIFGFFLIWLRVRKIRGGWNERLARLDGKIFARSENDSKGYGFLLVLAATVALWLTEPLHGVPAAVVSLATTSFLFLTRMLQAEDLRRVDWSTLLLIAGGITLGRLLEQSEIIKTLAAGIAWNELNPTFALFLLCLASATLSAMMSNTATVVLLIPLATALIPQPSTAILVAVSASFGLPFVISTPPNAMVFGEGGVKFNDLFLPGIILMIVGCLLVSLTGRFVLNLAGIP
jgi:solute carrier family 13 (sodium-dependent dicarboxylate transporter), member 2/3/5